MTPAELTPFLATLIDHQIDLSVMIWGPPGIGKSSIVADVGTAHGMSIIDLRLSQLAPTDLRGLPVPESGVSRWYPPEFLPRTVQGILFLDEINMAPPAMQGIAQQLILDRRVGSYTVPEGWFIWAAGNRKSDRASVFEMPSALANRFIHVDVEPDLDSFKRWAFRHDVTEQMLAFLSFRPHLLHLIDPQRPAWPSPRSWFMADRLHACGLATAPAVGEAAAGEFEAFCGLYESLPDLEAILAGRLDAVFPKERSAGYAACLGLIIRANTPDRAINGLRWLVKTAGQEWVQFYVTDVFQQLRERGLIGEMFKRIAADAELKQFGTMVRDLAFT
jgi:MoxR-like ATPase